CLVTKPQIAQHKRSTLVDKTQRNRDNCLSEPLHTFPPGEKGILRVLGTSRPAPLLEKATLKSRVDGAGAPCHNAHNVRCHLKKAPCHLQPCCHFFGHRLADLHDSLPQEGHERGMAWENPYETVVRRRDDVVRFAIEH